MKPQTRTCVVSIRCIGAVPEVEPQLSAGSAWFDVRHRISTEPSAVIAVSEMIGIAERTQRRPTRIWHR